MVAILNPGASIRDSFYYNENKVKAQVATCLMAVNYPLELTQLTEGMRLAMLQKMAGLNTRTTVNSLHISLNFDPSEQIPEARLKEIATDYMEQLGFGNQPYLVYQHSDAGHPHLHILTTNIQADGKRIDLHHLGIRKSEPARKNIEHRYNLVRAEDQKAGSYELQPVIPQKVNYGKSQTKRAIGNVLKSVVDTYKYASLAELNAVLNQYNVHADGGSKDSRIYKNNGLVYRILAADGTPVGVPVKASLFAGKPTLKYLYGRFKPNEIFRHKHKLRVKNTIDNLLNQHRQINLETFVDKMKKAGIYTAIRQNSDGLVYGLTYIDHTTKCVFNGSLLGKNYSAKAILERCKTAPQLPLDSFFQPLNGAAEQTLPAPFAASNDGQDHPRFPSAPVYNDPNDKGLIELLFEPEYTYEHNPWPLRRKRKKKKRKTS